MAPTRYCLELGSWDGSPLFRDVLLFPRVSFCTQAVVDLVRQNRFTNFSFERINEPPNHRGPLEVVAGPVTGID